jgi:hypothetical protein
MGLLRTKNNFIHFQMSPPKSSQKSLTSTQGLSSDTAILLTTKLTRKIGKDSLSRKEKGRKTMMMEDGKEEEIEEEDKEDSEEEYDNEEEASREERDEEKDEELERKKEEMKKKRQKKKDRKKVEKEEQFDIFSQLYESFPSSHSKSCYILNLGQCVVSEERIDGEKESEKTEMKKCWYLKGISMESGRSGMIILPMNAIVPIIVSEPNK